MTRTTRRPAWRGVILLALIVAGATAAATFTGDLAAARSVARLAAAAPCPAFPGADAFGTRIDNRYLPLFPGAVYRYSGEEDGDAQGRELKVTHATKTIIGVQTVVVRDTVRDAHGDLVEQTRDWFAQDDDGNVWYFGEDSKDYENGQVVSTAGSWTAGVDGAQPGIVMPANPRVGDSYSQECAPGVAEDAARNVSLSDAVKTSFGSFRRTLRTRETTPLEPDVAEDKWYAPCVGMVRGEAVRGGNGFEVLIAAKHAPSRSELGCKNGRGGRGSGKHQ